MVPVGTRLAEMARLRLQYDEARRNVQDIQQVKNRTSKLIRNQP